MKSSIVSGVWYENSQVMREVETILQSKCSVCNKSFKDKQSLKRHLSSDHKLMLCDICLRDKKAFPCELQTLANHRDLLAHQRHDHPACPACHTIFYGEDELGEHCRQKHELCHLCDRTRRAAPTLPTHISKEDRRTLESERAAHLASLANAPYYSDYSALESHFAKQHFLCNDPLCKELKFVVFADELELKAHQVDMHSTGPIRLQRSQQQQLRRLDVSFQRPSDIVSQASVPRSRDGRAADGRVSDQRVPQTTTTSRGISTIFGPVPEDLTKRLQTMSLLEARNQDLLNALNSLNLQPNAIALIQKSCQDYQGSVITADELIRRLDSWIGYQTLHGKTSSKDQKKPAPPPTRRAAWQPISVIKKEVEGEQEIDTKDDAGLFEKFLELQVDDFKRRELRHALEQHVYKQTSFPSLTPEDGKTVASTSGVSLAAPPKQKQLQLDKPVVLRLKPRTTGTRIPPDVDVSKNPAWLAGGIGSATINLKKKVKPKSPTQQPPKEEARIVRQVDASRPIVNTPPSPMESDTFVIGGEVPRPLPPPTRHSPTSEDATAHPSGTAGGGKKKNKERIVLLQTGMQRSA